VPSRLALRAIHYCKDPVFIGGKRDRGG